MKKIETIKRKLVKANKSCLKANMDCDALFKSIKPYLCENFQDFGTIFEQHGDGLVLECDSANYLIEDVIDLIEDGVKNISDDDLIAI